MNFSKKGFYSFLVALASGGILSSCVDNDYDLTKDIDLTVNVGGDLSLPGSSTELYTVAQILDLSSNSSIKPDGQLYGLEQGDYVLVQGGDPTNTSVSIPLQTLNDIQCNSSQASVQFVSPGNVAYEATVGDFVNQPRHCRFKHRPRCEIAQPCQDKHCDEFPHRHQRVRRSFG